MSSGSFHQVDVKCPYYISDNGVNKISCEGLIPGSSIAHFFRASADFKMQIRAFCSGCYWRCEVCEALDKNTRRNDDGSQNTDKKRRYIYP